MKPRLVAVLLLAAGAPVAVPAIEVTPALKKQVVTGMRAEIAATENVRSFPSIVVPVLIKAQKSPEISNAPLPVQLGFAMAALGEMDTFFQFRLALGPGEMSQTSVGWVLFTAQASRLQMQLKLTESQMIAIFGATAAHRLKEKPLLN
jgi:hypothetical protein